MTSAKAHPNLPVVVVSGYSSSENTDLPPEVLFVPKAILVEDASRLRSAGPRRSLAITSTSRRCQTKRRRRLASEVERHL